MTGFSDDTESSVHAIAVLVARGLAHEAFVLKTCSCLRHSKHQALKASCEEKLSGSGFDFYECCNAKCNIIYKLVAILQVKIKQERSKAPQHLGGV